MNLSPGKKPSVFLERFRSWISCILSPVLPSDFAPLYPGQFDTVPWHHAVVWQRHHGRYVPTLTLHYPSSTPYALPSPSLCSGFALCFFPAHVAVATWSSQFHISPWLWSLANPVPSALKLLIYLTPPPWWAPKLSLFLQTWIFPTSPTPFSTFNDLYVTLFPVGMDTAVTHCFCERGGAFVFPSHTWAPSRDVLPWHQCTAASTLLNWG